MERMGLYTMHRVRSRCGLAIVAAVLCLVVCSNEASAGAVEDLIGQLAHPIWTTRRDAALQLGAMSWEAIDAIDPLTKALQDRVGPVRYAAVTALGEIGVWAPSVVPVLAETLFDNDPEMRWQSAVALGNIGSRAVEAVPALAEALLDPYLEIRHAVAWALGMIGPGAREAIPALVEVMNGGDEEVQQMAKSAIAQIGGPQAVPPMAPTEAEVAEATTAGSQLVVIETAKGPIKAVLRGDLMPLTVANFTKLARSGFYDNLVFHRVEDWVVQGGDPEGTGRGGPGYTIKLETHTAMRNVRGAIAMARTANPDSAGSQFYILKTDAAWLDGEYAVFGQVIEGMDVVDQLAIGDVIKSVTIVQ